MNRSYYCAERGSLKDDDDSECHPGPESNHGMSQQHKMLPRLRKGRPTGQVRDLLKFGFSLYGFILSFSNLL